MGCPVTIVDVFVPGRPIPQGSLRAFTRDGQRVRLAHSNATALSAWRGTIAHAIGQRFPELVPFPGPVRVTVAFHLQRPKNHYRTGRLSEMLRPSAPTWPAIAPDLDKLSRAVLDALTGVVIRDDGQVVELAAVKRYAGLTPIGARIIVQPILPTVI